MCLASAAALVVSPTGTTSAQDRHDGGGRKQDSSWQCPLRASAWLGEPERIRASERPVRQRLVDSPDGAAEPVADPAWVRDTDAGTAFGIVGRIHSRRAMAWSMPLPNAPTAGGLPFLSVRCRAQGMARHTQPFAVLEVAGTDAEGKSASVTLLDAAEARNDGQWHRIVAKRVLPHRPQVLRVTLSTYDSEAGIELAEVRFSESVPRSTPVLSTSTLVTDGRSAGDLLPLDLGSALNGAWSEAISRVLDRQGMVTDPGWPTGSELRVGDSPLRFVLGGPERNLVVPPEDPSVNSQPASFAGTATTRH